MKRLLFCLLLLSPVALADSAAQVAPEDSEPAATYLEQAMGPRLDGFLDEIQGSRMPVRTMREALARLRAVRVLGPQDLRGATARYLIDANEIDISTELVDAHSGLLHLPQLGFPNAGVLAHELWHAYFWTLLRHVSGSQVMAEFSGKLGEFYPRDSSGKRAEIHEEAIGLFVGEVARDYLQFWSILTKASPAERQKLVANSKFTSLYEASFTASFRGYYRGWNGEVVYAAAAMPASTKAAVLREILDGALSGSFRKDFAEFLEWFRAGTGGPKTSLR